MSSFIIILYDDEVVVVVTLFSDECVNRLEDIYNGKVEHDSERTKTTAEVEGKKRRSV